MKKAFLLIFVALTGLIFYQIILGKNGILEAYNVRKQKEKLLLFKLILQKRNDELDSYLKFLNRDPDALLANANDLGFFKDEKKLIKVYNEKEADNSIAANSYLHEKLTLNELFNLIKNGSRNDKNIKILRSWLEVFFYLFFGFFIFLILFGVSKKDE